MVSGGAAFNYIKQSPTDVPKRSKVIRFDLRPTNADTIYWKYQWWTSTTTSALAHQGGRAMTTTAGVSIPTISTKTMGGRPTGYRVVNSSVVNEFNFGMRHDSEGFVPGDGEIRTPTTVCFELQLRHNSFLRTTT